MFLLCFGFFLFDKCSISSTELYIYSLAGRRLRKICEIAVYHYCCSLHVIYIFTKNLHRINILHKSLGWQNYQSWTLFYIQFKSRLCMQLYQYDERAGLFHLANQLTNCLKVYFWYIGLIMVNTCDLWSWAAPCWLCCFCFCDFSKSPWESSVKSEVPFVDYDEFVAKVFKLFHPIINV